MSSMAQIDAQAKLMAECERQDVEKAKEYCMLPYSM